MSDTLNGFDNTESRTPTLVVAFEYKDMQCVMVTEECGKA